ncbi:MAG TPA: EVE domain-containing protein [bacterium]|nr:EVE domain-containing protein [bacterium]
MSFIFQAIPQRYNLKDRLKEGDVVPWIASRYHDHMKMGEVVYFWMGGDRKTKGLYGWGKITDQAPFVDSNNVYRVNVKIERRFENFIPVSAFTDDPVMKNHLLFRMPIGTNFLLNEQEEAAIKKIIADTQKNNSLPRPNNEVGD